MPQHYASSIRHVEYILGSEMALAALCQNGRTRSPRSSSSPRKRKSRPPPILCWARAGSLLWCARAQHGLQFPFRRLRPQMLQGLSSVLASLFFLGEGPHGCTLRLVLMFHSARSRDRDKTKAAALTRGVHCTCLCASHSPALTGKASKEEAQAFMGFAVC